MQTFAQIETDLKNRGFEKQILNHKISTFKKENEIAYVYYLGEGQGFEMVIYELQPKTKPGCPYTDTEIGLLLTNLDDYAHEIGMYPGLALDEPGAREQHIKIVKHWLTHKS